MYWRDHPPPHLHAFYQGFEGIFDLRDGELLAGELPIGVRRIVRAWIGDWRYELMANWDRARMGLPFEAIPGADQS